MGEPTILIVDDDRTIVRLCQRLLERASYQVVSAMNPLDALKILEQQKIDLLISDIHMPGMDGFELVSQAKQRQSNLPVLVMTGFGSMDNAIQALHRGVDGLLLKPFENASELVEAVRHVLGESQQKRDAARLQVLRPLFNVTERLLTETSPEPLEKLILEMVSGSFQAEMAGIYRFNPLTGQLEIIRACENGQEQPSQEPGMQDPFYAAAQARISLLQQIILPAVADGSPVILLASRSSSHGVVQPLLAQMGWEALLVAPIQQKDDQLVLCASRPAGRPAFTEADQEMFAILARQAAVAMENARLYSELKEKVRQVEESQRALIQAEKMAAVGRLMASLAHEINNPLQSVRNCLHLASHKGVKTSQRQHYLEMTDKELERLVMTVRRMLDFYRPGGADRELVQLAQVIDQVLALIRPQLREQGIQMHTQVNGSPVAIFAVRDQIQQVIFNLLLNAMDAIEEGQVADRQGVDVRGVESHKEIWLDVFYEDYQVRIMVEDSGPGISVELSKQLFEPFFSTKPHGTGLGLAISYGIIERHHGCLTILPSRYRGGACFEVVLPVGDELYNGKNSDCR